jgi:hypothetical protein
VRVEASKKGFNQQKWDFNGILTGFELDLINNIWILPMNTGDGFVLNRFKKEIPQSGDFNGGNDDFFIFECLPSPLCLGCMASTVSEL